MHRESQPDPDKARCSPACERNAEAIEAVLADCVPPGARVLEIGSGTGQHAAWMVDHLADVTWQPSDLEPERDSIAAWAVSAQRGERIADATVLDVRVAADWDAAGPFDLLFTANTLHIMPWDACVALFAQASRRAVAGARLAVYGPFHVGGRPTSDSNARFDDALRADAGGMGIRDLGDVRALAAAGDWLEQAHYQMPANNQMLVWQRVAR